MLLNWNQFSGPVIVKAKVTIKVEDLNFNLLVGSVSPFLADVKILYLNNNLFMGTILQVSFSCLLITCLFVYFPLDPFHFFQMLSLCPWYLFHYYFPCKSSSPLIHIADSWSSGVQNSLDLAHHWNNVVHNLLDLAHPWSRFDEHMFNRSCTSLKQIWWAYVHLILHIIDSVMKGWLTWNVLSWIHSENLVQVIYLLKNPISGANFWLHSMFWGGGRGCCWEVHELVTSFEASTLQSLYLQNNYLSNFGDLGTATIPPTVVVCVQYNCELPPPNPCALKVKDLLLDHSPNASKPQLPIYKFYFFSNQSFGCSTGF